MKKVSIKDIASIVGVSTATVSLVLSDKAKNGRVSEDMINKIKSVALQMNYQPNLLAQSLQSGLSKTIGLLVADITNSFFSQLAFHIQKEMQRHGYAVIIVNTDEDTEQMKNMIYLLKSRQVDGFIIVPNEGGDKLIEELHENKFPLVLVDRYFPRLNTCNVLVDNFDVTFKATSYLLEKGCEKIVFMTYVSDLIQVKERERGYKEAMMKYGKFDNSYIQRVRYANLEEDVKSAIHGMKQKSDLYDGIIFSTNSISLTGVKELTREGFKIGKEIEVVCFDKSDCFDLLSIPISYVHQPIADIGRMATTLLIEQIVNSELKPENNIHLIPCVFNSH